MPATLWTPAATEDLEQIFLFVGREQRSPSAAARVIRRIVENADIYASQPFLGPARPELGESIRACYIHRYVIFYRPVSAGIEVLRVIHGSRDVFRVFQGQEP